MGCKLNLSGSSMNSDCFDISFIEQNLRLLIRKEKDLDYGGEEMQNRQ